MGVSKGVGMDADMEVRNGVDMDVGMGPRSR